MRFVIALGGNALLRRGQALAAKNLIDNAKQAATQIAALAQSHEIVLVHGNGPQVGLLALQNAAYEAVPAYPFDILDAESQGMIGYILEQRIDNALKTPQTVCLLTRVCVNRDDPAFNELTKPIGPVYSKREVEMILSKHAWTFKQDGEKYRRVVASPKPQAILELSAIELLLTHKKIVIASGGGGIPCIANGEGSYEGVEAVIDKDLTACLLAEKLNADKFIILTDVDGIYQDWKGENQRLITNISAKALSKLSFPVGSMQPKATAACRFVEKTQRSAYIGNLNYLNAVVDGSKGTRITYRQ